MPLVNWHWTAQSISHLDSILHMAGFSLVQSVQLMMLSANCTLLYTCVLKNYHGCWWGTSRPDFQLSIMKIRPIFSYKHGIIVENFRSRRWGSSLTVCACLMVRSFPHQHERKFSGAHVCRVTFKHLPQPLRSHTWSPGILGQLLKLTPYVRPNIA